MNTQAGLTLITIQGFQDDMEELIDERTEESVRQIAKRSMEYLEPICEDCWKKGRDDPFGMRSGVNTPPNKKINRITDQIIDNTPEADEMWRTEVRDDLIEIFYNERRRLFRESSRKVDNTLECFYCYEERKSDEEKLSIRVKDMEESRFFGRDENQWR